MLQIRIIKQFLILFKIVHNAKCLVKLLMNLLPIKMQNIKTDLVRSKVYMDRSYQYLKTIQPIT